MPNDRVLLHAEPALQVEDVRSHPGAAEWSPVYTTASARIVLPMGGTALEVRDRGGTRLMDALTAMRFTDAQRYQLRPCAPTRRHSLVVSALMADRDASEPGYWRLQPRTLYRLHVASRSLRSGRADALDTPAFFGQVMACRESIRPRGAVARARRFLNTDADACFTASRHDIADAVACSDFHLSRSFRQQMGLGLHQYRQHMRLAAALERLAAGDRDLAGIAHDLGYCSQSHLGAVFLREVGVTLGAARRALNPVA